jgi:hypothetical protein
MAVLGLSDFEKLTSLKSRALRYENVFTLKF